MSLEVTVIYSENCWKINIFIWPIVTACSNFIFILPRFRFEFLVSLTSTPHALPQFFCLMIEKWLLISHSHYLPSPPIHIYVAHAHTLTYRPSKKKRSEKNKKKIKMFIFVEIGSSGLCVCTWEYCYDKDLLNSIKKFSNLFWYEKSLARFILLSWVPSFTWDRNKDKRWKKGRRKGWAC
jgi:hypothetical protein